MNIQKMALDYINEGLTSTAGKKKKRTRVALQRAYDKIRDQYASEKKVVDSIKTEGLALQKEYVKHKEKMEKFYKELLAVRNQINHIDDEGTNVFILPEEEKSEPVEENTEEDNLYV